MSSKKSAKRNTEDTVSDVAETVVTTPSKVAKTPVVKVPRVKKEPKVKAPAGKRGRPSNPNSARAIRLMAQAARIANGETIHRGRPKKVVAQ